MVRAVVDHYGLGLQRRTVRGPDVFAQRRTQARFLSLGDRRATRGSGWNRRMIRVMAFSLDRLGSVQNEIHADTRRLATGVWDQGSKTLNATGQYRSGIDADDPEPDLAAALVQQRDTDRRGHDFLVAHIPQCARDHDHQRGIAVGPRAHGFEIQSGRVHRRTNHGIGGSGPGPQIDDLDPEQHGRGDQADEDAGKSGPDRTMSRGLSQAALLFLFGAVRLGQFRRRGLGQGFVGVVALAELGLCDVWGRGRQVQRLLVRRGVPDMGARLAAHLAALRADRSIGREIAGGAGRAGQYHVV